MFTKKGFSLVEITISIALLFMIIAAITSSFGQSMLNFNIGNKVNDTSFSKFFLMKDIYNTVINMNKRIEFNGEDLDVEQVNFIEFSDRKEEKDHYGRLAFNRYYIDDIEKVEKIEYYFHKNKLFKKTSDKSKNILNNVQDLFFYYKNGIVYCSGIMEVKEKDKKIKNIPFEFGVFAKGEKIGVKFK